MSVRKYFFGLQHIVPYDMEETLENMGRQGLELMNVGQTGLLFFDFREVDPKKYRYVVDYSNLPKQLYIDELTKKGWSYLGKSGDCYIWRMEYDEEVPKKFYDKIGLIKHCKMLGIILALLTLLCLGTMVGLIWAAYFEHSQGVSTHIIMYIIEAILQLPFIVGFGWLAYKVLGAIKFYEY